MSLLPLRRLSVIGMYVCIINNSTIFFFQKITVLIIKNQNTFVDIQNSVSPLLSVVKRDNSTLCGLCEEMRPIMSPELFSLFINQSLIWG
jgi:hypothetical protein